MSNIAFAIGAHPDDIEFGMSGTLMHLKDSGYELHVMTLANGSCGSTRHDAETIVKMRREEARNAAAVLGAAFHESLVNDIDIFYEKPLLARLASVIREVGPEILLTHSPQDYMEDHMNTCRLAVSAAFCRGMPNFPVDPPRPHITGDVTVYHAQPHGNRDALWNVVKPQIYVDVSDVIGRKGEVLACHRTQKDWLDESQGMDSYIHAMEELNREVGRMSGRFRYAEGWRRHSPLGMCRLDADPLSAALVGHVLVRVAT